MGIWDTAKDIFSGGGSSDIDQAYKDAQERMYPYQKGGAEDYQNYRNYVGQQGQNLSPFQHAGDWQYNQINQSPVDYYNQIMGGYNQSPQAKYEQEQSMRAATAGGSASGMTGSGAFQKALQQNAGDISARDQQRFYGNVMGANAAQMGYLGDLRNQQSQYNQMQQYLTNLGYGAAGQMGQNDMSHGQQQAQIGRQTIGDIASLFGFSGGGGGQGGGGGLFNSGQGGQGGGQGGQGGGSNGGMDYAKLAMMFAGG